MSCKRFLNAELKHRDTKDTEGKTDKGKNSEEIQ